MVVLGVDLKPQYLEIERVMALSMDLTWVFVQNGRWYWARLERNDLHTRDAVLGDRWRQ